MGQADFDLMESSTTTDNTPRDVRIISGEVVRFIEHVCLARHMQHDDKALRFLLGFLRT